MVNVDPSKYRTFQLEKNQRSEAVPIDIKNDQILPIYQF
jgi:hypothetical protein